MADTLKKVYLLVTEKKWHDQLFANLKTIPNSVWHRIDTKEKFTFETISSYNPDRIFIPHWSYIIPGEIFRSFECILFHMTDLPFGWGGSPLQNLICLGFEETTISAIRVEKGVDEGMVYLKKGLSLNGTAAEIYLRASAVVETMIQQIILTDPQPFPQHGEVVVFKRRKPEESNIARLKELKQIYDFIRMLDCEGYPNAFLETDHFRFEFTNAQFLTNQSVTAHVRIVKK